MSFKENKRKREIPDQRQEENKRKRKIPDQRSEENKIYRKVFGPDNI